MAESTIPLISWSLFLSLPLAPFNSGLKPFASGYLDHHPIRHLLILTLLDRELLDDRFFLCNRTSSILLIRFPSSRTNPTYPRRLDLKILFSDLEKRVDRLIIHHLKK